MFDFLTNKTQILLRFLVFFYSGNFLVTTHQPSDGLQHTDHLDFSLLFVVFHHRDSLLTRHEILINLSDEWLQILILTLTALQHSQEPIALIDQHRVIFNSLIARLGKLCHLIASLNQTEKLLFQLALPFRSKLGEMD